MSEIHHKYNINSVEVCIKTWAPNEWDSIELIQIFDKFASEIGPKCSSLTRNEWELACLQSVTYWTPLWSQSGHG